MKNARVKFQAVASIVMWLFAAVLVADKISLVPYDICYQFSALVFEAIAIWVINFHFKTLINPKQADLLTKYEC